MALLHLVTGRAGAEHVTGADHGALNAALLMAGNFVLNTGNKFSASIVTNNSIKILDGELIMQGRHVRLKPGLYEEVAIENGTQDYKRNDLIVVRYTKDENTGIENTSFVVIKGTPDATKATDPEYIAGDIINGDLVCDMPLYRVPIDGLNVGDLVPLFEVADSLGARIDAIINGTIKVGNADKLDGHEAEYFATAESVDNIQTTSKATLSQAGWYRVAEYDGNGGYLMGSVANSCELEIRRFYNSGTSEYHKIMLVSTMNSQTFDTVDQCGKQFITKVRYAYDTDKAYLEIYADNACEIFTRLKYPNDFTYSWELLDTPTLTSETVSGVTVTTTYDIPANASPVTDLDVSKIAHTGTKIVEVTDFNDLTEPGIFYCSTQPGLTNYPVSANGFIRVEVANGKVYQTYIDAAYFKEYKRHRKNSTEWTPWEITATTADLANYLSLSGGRLSKNKIVALEIENTATNASVIDFYGVDGIMGGFGFNGRNVPICRTAEGSVSTLHHDGNSKQIVVSSTPLSASDTNKIRIY